MNFDLLLSVALFTLLSGCQGQVACHHGQRTTSNGVVSFDQTLGIFCNESSQCVKFTFHNQQGSASVKSEYRSCSLPGFDTSGSCSTVASIFTPSVSPDNCTFENCRTFACNSFDLPPGCSNTDLPNDIRVLPNCTLRTSLRKGLECLKPLVAGYPYNDQATCRSDIDSALVCGVSLMTTCLSGPCPTILDIVPTPLRTVYSEIVNFAQNFTSVASLFSTLGINSSIVDQALNQACPSPGLPQNLPLQLHNITFDQLLAMLNTTKQQLETILVNPICNSTALIDLMEKSLVDLQQGVLAKNHSVFCRSMNSLKSNIANTWRIQCNKTAALALIQPLIPSAYSPLYPQIVKAMDIVEEEMFDSSGFPGCEVDAAMTTAPSETTAPTAETTSGVARASILSALNLLCSTVFVMMWF